MIDDTQQPRCSSCDIELPGGAPTIHGEAFCCRGCAAGGPCVCTYDELEAVRAMAARIQPGFLDELLRIYAD